MKITLTEVSIRELTDGYVDNADAGVVGFAGRLDIRPAYQREFVYNDKRRDAVIDSVFKNYPLNVMYWAVRDDGGFEVIDGQQRTISLCQYVAGEFSFNGRYFNNLQDDEKKRLLEYKLTVYRCDGTDSEKLAWFEIINIAGEKLTDQELRNAVYHGSWVSAAKLIFSKNNCPAYAIGKDYLTGSPIRQEYLETVISWISNNDVRSYMAAHQHDLNANTEWLYFQSVIAWINATFSNYRHEMKGIAWGELYNIHKNDPLDAGSLEIRIANLMLDEDVTSKKGIYSFVLNGDDRKLSIRSFSDKNKREAFESQKGVCPICRQTFTLGEMEADHITPWSQGGNTTSENCQMLCKEDNRRKSNI